MVISDGINLIHILTNWHVKFAAKILGWGSCCNYPKLLISRSYNKESTHLLEGESRCGSLMLGQLLPFLFSDMFGHQTVGRLDFGEGFSLGQANKKSNWVQNVVLKVLNY